MLRPKQKLFIQYYTDIKSNTFSNAAESYRQAYKIAKKENKTADYCDSRASRIMSIPEVKKVIEGRMKKIWELTREDYIAKVEKELEQCKNASVRARLLELIGKVHNFTKDNEIQQTNVIFTEAQKTLKDRIDKASCSLP